LANPSTCALLCTPPRPVTFDRVGRAHAPLPSSPPRSFPLLQPWLEVPRSHVARRRFLPILAGWLLAAHAENTRAGFCRLLPGPDFEFCFAVRALPVPSRVLC